MSLALDWNLLLPAVSSTHQRELHLDCGDCVVFYCPIRSAGLLWRAAYGIAQITSPVTAPEFVRAMMARGVVLPRGELMRAWSTAITGGKVVTEDASQFLLIADQMDTLAAADATSAGRPH